MLVSWLGLKAWFGPPAATTCLLQAEALCHEAEVALESCKRCIPEEWVAGVRHAGVLCG